MGLDQYLIKRKHVGKAKIKIVENEYEWYENKDEEIEGVSSINIEAGYWRKANQIHKWFVDNIQNGVDDCGEYYAPIEKLEELYSICKDILEHCKLVKGKVNNGYTFKDGVETPIIVDGEVMTNPEYAEELLPTTSGCFFGSTDYDEYYMRGIDNTIKILEEALKDKDCDYYYTSSW